MSNLTIYQAETGILQQLPTEIQADQEIIFALRKCLENEKLRSCTPDSIASCIQQAKAIGLSFNPFLGQIFLIPRWNSRLSTYVCTLQGGYKGYQLLIEPEMTIIRCDVVRVGDVFEEVDKPGFPYIHRKRLPKPGEDQTQGAIYAAYAIAMRNGHEVWRVLNLPELDEKVRTSNSWDAKKNCVIPGSARDTNPAPMHMKDVILALINRYPIKSRAMAMLLGAELAGMEMPTGASPTPAEVVLTEAPPNDENASEIYNAMNEWYKNASEADKAAAAAWKNDAIGTDGKIRKRTPTEVQQFLAMRGVEV